MTPDEERHIRKALQYHELAICELKAALSIYRVETESRASRAERLSERVVAAVCAFYRVSQKSWESKTAKESRIAFPRRVAAYIYYHLREDKPSDRELSEFINRRNTMGRWSVKKVTDEMSISPAVKNEVEMLMKQLQEYETKSESPLEMPR